MSPRSRVMALLLPSALLGGWVVLALGKENSPLTVCRHRTADGHEARPVDLARVDREYSKAARAFRERLKGVEHETLAWRDRGYDSGVKACLRPETRMVLAAVPLPARLWGRRVYFLVAPGGGRLPSGLRASLDPDSVVFLLRYPSIEEAGRLAQELKVGVSPTSPTLAQRFGIRCQASIVDVSRDGKTLSIQELAP